MEEVGGIVGIFTGEGDVHHCYNIGEIVGVEDDYWTAYPGQIVGQYSDAKYVDGNYVFYDGGKIRYCYADSSNPPMCGRKYIFENDFTISNVTVKTTAQMKDLAELKGFTSTYWGTDPNINNGYPYLKNLAHAYN